MIAALAAIGVILLALAIWELVVCEGAHLGPRVVIPLYDLTAHRYDGIKHFDWEWRAASSAAPAGDDRRAARSTDSAC